MCLEGLCGGGGGVRGLFRPLSLHGSGAQLQSVPTKPQGPSWVWSQAAGASVLVPRGEQKGAYRTGARFTNELLKSGQEQGREMEALKWGLNSITTRAAKKARDGELNHSDSPLRNLIPTHLVRV